MSEDRKAYGQVLEAVLGILAHNARALDPLARQHAESLGIQAMGVLPQSPEGTPVLRFPQDAQLKIRWDEVDAQLATIGRPTGLYSVPSEALLGIQGERGNIAVRVIDIQQHRLDGVIQYLKENLPAVRPQPV